MSPASRPRPKQSGARRSGLLADHHAAARSGTTDEITLCRTDIVLVKLLVGVVDSALADIEADGKIFAHDPWIPLSGVDGFEYAVDINFLQLVDQDHRRIAVWGNVACRHSDCEPLVQPVAEALHDLAGLGAVLCDVGIITRQ